MSTPTYVALATATVTASGGSSSIDFTNIPQTYTDLKLVLSVRNTSTNPTMVLTLNSSSSNFSRRFLVGTGSSVSTASGTENYFPYVNVSTDTASTFSNNELYFPNYTANQNKSFSMDTAAENNATTAYVSMQATLWSNTSAISSMNISVFGGNLAQHSTLYLYGILKQ